MIAAFMILALTGRADFTICDAAGHQLCPAVASQAGQNYAFWTDYRTSPAYALYGCRVSATGTVIDPDGKLLFSDSVFFPRVACAGTDLMVVWREGC